MPIQHSRWIRGNGGEGGGNNVGKTPLLGKGWIGSDTEGREFIRKDIWDVVGV